MPELPEVETIRRVLADKISGRRIVRISVCLHRAAASRLSRTLRSQGAALRKNVHGRRIMGIRRRAKYLLVDLDEGVLLFHLGMTGQLFAARGGQVHDRLPSLPDKHTHLILYLSGGLQLYFRDIRKFGRVCLLARGQERRVFQGLGPEPFSKAFTPAVLQQGLKGKKASVKSLLLGQKIVAGLGNIYADEALYRAGIAPQTPGGRVWPEKITVLHTAVRAVLRQAIRFRGTSLSDYYDPESRQGQFQDRLRVYGRQGDPCRQCGTSVLKAVVAGRGTHWCPACQRQHGGKAG
ncbi:bifunctional DNA-formamidopyrimidine glycosylase/DNA-(apurinic or apyrimidinic site) lyase [candidate division FCPU426 bacterium]|nr:bifunctional DNA-formamidopyrimidine glycosylase/DNA-(apurinic or apyrimidinic site) lyase [candidate division FCPU426 bacterium]